MASDKLKIGDKFLLNLANDVINLTGADLKVALFASTSNIETLSLEFYTELTDELATANGYTQGGKSIANLAISEAAGITKIDGDNVTWTAAGGSITARYAGVYDDVAVGKPIVGYILLDNTPADLVALDTQQFTVEWASGGVFNLAADNA